MPSKSIFRQPGAQHFQLVHRSQRDPLIHDPDASQHVLKPFERENVKKGKSRAELEDLLACSDSDDVYRANIGEVAMYGVLFDDSEYDYMQHLRQVGAQEDGVESVLIEAPSTSKKPKARSKGEGNTLLRDLPSEVLPSSVELPRDYESEEAIPSSIAGIQPDMDPHLRQVLEALEDDAFVDDDLHDEFFQQLVADGERKSDDQVEFEFRDEGEVNAEEGGVTVEDGEIPDNWEARFERFKKDQKAVKLTSDYDSDADGRSEGDDTVSGLPLQSVIGGKRRRRKGTSDASGYSMSSSSLYRTDALKTLDERFDQMMLREYAEDDDEGDDSAERASSDDSDTAPQLLTSREDFVPMVDDFLDNYEVLGSRMKPKLAGDSGTEKLGILRTAMGHDERIRIRNEVSDEEHDLVQLEDEDEKDRWDCETILTTYSNLENHPRLIRARDPGVVRKIRLDPRTGLPNIPDQKSSIAGAAKSSAETNDEKPSLPKHTTIRRPHGETNEERKARKQLVKDERQSRRVHKKATKNQFTTELKQQKKVVINTEKPKMHKL